MPWRFAGAFQKNYEDGYKAGRAQAFGEMQQTVDRGMWRRITMTCKLCGWSGEIANPDDQCPRCDVGGEMAVSSASKDGGEGPVGQSDAAEQSRPPTGDYENKAVGGPQPSTPSSDAGTDWRGIHNDEGAELLREVVKNGGRSLGPTGLWERVKAWAADGENQESAPGVKCTCIEKDRIANGCPIHNPPLGMTYAPKLPEPIQAGAVVDFEADVRGREPVDDARMDSSEGGGGRLASNLSSPSSSSDDVSEDGIGWYVSDTHARRAIGYLSASVPELQNVEIPRLAKAWGEALEKTMDGNERSPIGPETGVPSASPGPDDWSELLMAAKHVVLWDWSDNDSDAYTDILRLRDAVGAFHSNETDAS